MDTRNKRFSIINVGLPFGRVFPNPDGAIDTSAERLQWATLYAFGTADPDTPTFDPPFGSGLVNNQRSGSLVTTNQRD